MNSRQKHFRKEWQRVNQELRDCVYEDPQLFQELTPAEVHEDLIEMGIDCEKLAALKERIRAAAQPTCPAEWLRPCLGLVPSLRLAVQSKAISLWSKVVSLAQILDDGDEDLTQMSVPLSKDSSNRHHTRSIEVPNPLRKQLPWVGERLHIKAKPFPKDSLKTAFLVSADVLRGTAKVGALGVAIKFKSSDTPAILFLRPREPSLPIGFWPDSMDGVDVQLFVLTCD
jgi:hypothetical protein